MVLVLALARSEDAWDRSHLVEIDPQSAHGVVHARKDLHRRLAGVVANKLLVDLEDSLELAVERGAVDVREIEIRGRLAIDAESVLVYDLVDGASGHIAR